MAYQQSRTSCHNRGVVLIMVVAILATLALAGTAFVVIMGQESKAASSTLYLAQAELAARSGLEHAIGAIDESNNRLGGGGSWLVVTPDGVLQSDGITFTDTEGSIDAGWHRYFEEGTADPVASWVSHYFVDADTNNINDERYGATSPIAHEMRGRVIDFPSDAVARYGGQYTVCVTDLDGKLHANLARWTNDVGGNSTSNPVNQAALVGALAGTQGAGLPDAERDNLIDSSGSNDQEYCSVSEIARRAATATPTTKYALERFFTAYPVASLEVEGEFTASACNFADPNTNIEFSPDWSLLEAEAIGLVVRFATSGACFRIVAKPSDTEVTVAGNCSSIIPPEAFRILPPRPAVNVNTAPETLLAELFKPIPSFDDDRAEALAKLICERRPFANRHELEDIIFRATGSDGIVDLGDYHAILPADTHLSERQFNDCLNSIAGVLEDHESAFDEPSSTGIPGVYSFDGWEPFADGIGPSQIGGTHSNSSGVAVTDVGDPEDNVTWSTELKFNSRFFHIYVIGRAWNENTGEPTGVKRLHAVYDSRPPAGIIWLRWNLSSRGSLTDM